MPGHPYGYARCPGCGLNVPANQLEGGGHTCNPESALTHQVSQARNALDRLENDIAEYLTTERARNLLAFRRWCLEHGR